MKNICKNNLFSMLTQLLIIILPFYVIIAVYFTHVIGISKAGFFIKELVIILLFFSLIFQFIKAKKIPKLDMVDYLIFAYFIYGIGITLFNGLGLNSIAYGGRYDFIFFLVFLIFKHGKQFLTFSNRDLLKTFIWSASLSLLLSILIKFRLGEKALLSFGFTDYVSNWTYSGSIPNYHGLENSGIKRFQGIFDGPNQMAFFLILYTSLLLQFIRKKFEYYVVLMVSVLFGLLILTFSRSALLGVFSGFGLVFLLNIKDIYKKYKKIFLYSLVAFFLVSSAILFVFHEKVENIFLRTSSTTGHFDRMEIGIERFKSKPMGAGLSEAGPAYRNIYTDKQNKEAEQYYIPESWFIQQLIEGGIIYFTLFILILSLILIKTYKRSKPIFAGIIAILIMNVFLHIFEATYLSILLFIFVGLFYKKK